MAATEQINFRVTPTEKARMRREAEALGLSVSELLRRPWAAWRDKPGEESPSK